MRAHRVRLLIAETIAVGSELLLGGRTDSNSLFITEELAKIGISRNEITQFIKQQLY